MADGMKIGAGGGTSIEDLKKQREALLKKCGEGSTCTGETGGTTETQPCPTDTTEVHNDCNTCTGETTETQEGCGGGGHGHGQGLLGKIGNAADELVGKGKEWVKENPGKAKVVAGAGAFAIGYTLARGKGIDGVTELADKTAGAVTGGVTGFLSKIAGAVGGGVVGYEAVGLAATGLAVLGVSVPPVALTAVLIGGGVIAGAKIGKAIGKHFGKKHKAAMLGTVAGIYGAHKFVEDKKDMGLIKKAAVYVVGGLGAHWLGGKVDELTKK